MRNLILFIMTITVISCGATTQFITQEYTGKRMNGHSLTICIDKDRIIIDNPDDVTDDLGPGIVTDVYYVFLDSAVSLALPRISTFKEAQFQDHPVSALKRTAFTISKNGTQIEMGIPADNTLLAFNGEVPSYILFIDMLQITRDHGSAGTMVMGAKGQMTMMGGRAAALQTKCNYVLWDNKESKTIAYGTITPSSSLFIAMTKGTWQSNVSEMVRLILRKSPFYVEPQDF